MRVTPPAVTGIATISVLPYAGYLKLMTVCEEAFTGAKDFDKQLMFSGAGGIAEKIRKGIFPALPCLALPCLMMSPARLKEFRCSRFLFE